jgi:hypothetical protein
MLYFICFVLSLCMDFGIAETGIARGSPPGTTTEVLRVGFPSAEIRFVSFQLLQRAVKDTPVVSLNTVTRVVHFRLLARRLTRIHRRRPRPWRWASRLRPRADVDPTAPTITRTTTSFGTEVSPAWTPNALSLNDHQNLLYIHVNVD